MLPLEQRIVEYIPNLRRYARALLRGNILASDDLVQDCLERALSRIHRWREGSDLRAWLFTIMHNVYANQMRRLTNGPQFVELTGDIELTDNTGAAEQQLKLRDLHHAIADLQNDQREILLLVSLEGLRYQQVSKILGIPEGTVMSKLSRARQQLRKVMAEPKPDHIRRVK